MEDPTIIVLGGLGIAAAVYAVCKVYVLLSYAVGVVRRGMDEENYGVAYTRVRNTKSYRRQKERRKKQGNDREFTVGAPKFEPQGRK